MILRVRRICFEITKFPNNLDHDEFDSISLILLNASARDLQGYVDAPLSLSLLNDSID